ncbi:LuxR family transcriptional regulator [Microbispora sp. RL4-1S]|uniref:LuxR family transcriptional regulator n=1 Tax=Microbispora oryzae TaxID=2806554 RepID=A0A941AJV9_9ACTN|nr:LuxR C-terminal-related transcriptional regulator [Microbispora oryzae]MBP2706795.1 LuxR family transcriptional regulator [Microbispora oryzae]
MASQTLRNRVLQGFGLDTTSESVYLTILTDPDSTVADLALRLGLAAEVVQVSLDRLRRLSLLRPSRENPGALCPVSPGIALEALIKHQEAELVRQQNQIAESRAAIAVLEAEYAITRYTSGDVLERLADIDAIRERLVQLSSDARHEFLSLLPVGALSAESMAASRPLDERMLDRGVDVRAVFLDTVDRDRATSSYARWLMWRGAQVRTVPMVPIRMVIVDREVAMVPVDPAHSALGAVLVRGEGVVVAMSTLFDLMWERGRDFGASRTRDRHGLTDQERELLGLLYKGHTDEAVARKLGISLRTCRRITADLTNRLGARSRFEAGARAAERGWFRSPATEPDPGAWADAPSS